ncbi:MAG: DUF533 domain-containing protein [Vicinamibacterales bacterium]
MDAEDLIGSVIRGALTGGSKRSRGTIRHLTGGAGSFITASTLMTVAGVAWGLYETAQRNNAASTSPVGAPPAGAPPVPGAVPPLPGSPAAAGGPPPLPVSPPSNRDISHPGVPDGVARLVRLTVSAARADGALSAAEEARILEHARQVGAEALVAQEIRNPTALDAIVDGVTDPQQRRDLYSLAFAIVRADETVSGSERIYLAQLAHRLGLDASTVSTLEAEASSRIAAADAAPPSAS